MPSLSNNWKSFTPGFLTVNISLVVIAVELFWALIALNLICCPSFKLWPVAVTTPGLAAEIVDALKLTVVDKLSNVAVAPEVEPVIEFRIFNSSS